MEVIVAQKELSGKLEVICTVNGGTETARSIFEQVVSEMGLEAPDENGLTRSKNYSMIQLVTVPLFCPFFSNERYDVMRRVIKQLL